MAEQLSGRELDAEIHRRVMRRECVFDIAMLPELMLSEATDRWPPRDWLQVENGQITMGIALPGGPIRLPVPHYGESIEAAMLVVEKMRGGAEIIQMNSIDGEWRVYISQYGQCQFASAQSLPEAISRAALKAVEGQNQS